MIFGKVGFLGMSFIVVITHNTCSTSPCTCCIARRRQLVQFPILHHDYCCVLFVMYEAVVSAAAPIVIPSQDSLPEPAVLIGEQGSISRLQCTV